MKKMLLFIAALVLVPMSMMAQYSYWKQPKPEYEKPSWKEVKGACIIHGGYNFLQKSSIAGIDLCCNIGYIRGNFEIGWSYVPYDGLNHHFYYTSISVGPTIGRRSKFYAQIGGLSWCGFHKNNFYDNYWHAKVKTGSDIYLSEVLMLNIELGYIIPYRDNFLHFDEALSLRAGIGVKF